MNELPSNPAPVEELNEKARPRRPFRSALVILPVVLACCAAGSAVLPVVRRHQIDRKLERVKTDQRTIQVALESLFVDDCGNTYPDPENALPAKLTTPIAYLPSLPVDPFAGGGEPYRLFTQLNRGNGTAYLIVSRGPDGDLDSSRLPYTKIFPAPVQLPKGTVWVESFDKEGRRDFKVDAPFAYWSAHVVAYGMGVDKTVRVPQSTYRFLPGDSGDWDRWMTRRDLAPYLAEHGISVYDPTNGARSDGDSIRFGRE